MDEQTKTTTFAHLHPDGSFSSFYPSRAAVKMCGAPDDEIVGVRLVPDAAGSYWCWHDFEKNEFCMCWRSLVQLMICFPCGIEPAEKRGTGIRVRVSVKKDTAQRRSEDYWGQKNSKYADCMPRTIVNACVFHGVPYPKPETEAWEEVLDFSECRSGASVMGIDELADYFGLRATKIPWSNLVGRAPISLPVYNPEYGDTLHSVLIVGWERNVATVVGYRVDSGPLVENLPLLFGEKPPRVGGSNYVLDRSFRWGAMYIPSPPNNRCYLIEKSCS